MQIRNLLIAAGATVVGMTAIAAVPATASAQEYRHAPVYQAYDNHRDYGRYDNRRYEARRFWEARRLAELRREELRRRHHYGYRY